MAVVRVDGRYRLRDRVGSGSFGEVFLATDILTKADVAVKLESVDAEDLQLEREAMVYRILAGGIGVPKLRWSGVELNYNAMVIDFLGPSLEVLFTSCGRKFTLKTVLLIADQLITRVEWVHSHHLIHCDIKPDNFLVGANDNAHIIHIIDFGLTVPYKNLKTRRHIPYREGEELLGTVRYASLNAHIGVVQTRRDDIESLAYVLIYFLRGSLPWQGLNVRADGKRDRVKIMKGQLTPGDLCDGLPDEFHRLLTYARALQFDEQPDYDYLRTMFRELAAHEGYEYDFVFDWTTGVAQQHDRKGVGIFGGVGSRKTCTSSGKACSVRSDRVLRSQPYTTTPTRFASLLKSSPFPRESV